VPRSLAPTDADAVTRACLGAISGPDGPTDQQLSILRAIATHLWGVRDVDLSPGAALSAAEAGARITDPVLTRRTRELMVLLELCRHPLEASHQQRVEDYCMALGEDGPGLALARTYVAEGAAAASDDFLRRFLEVAPEMMEPAMLEIADAEEAEAARRLAEIDAALHAAAPGTLGAEFVAFYERNGFTVGPQAVPLFGHDMTHVIGGYDATPIGEICIGVMKLMITDSDVHWIEFLGNVMIHETGIVPEGYTAHEPALTDPANVALMIRAMERGRDTATDFSTVDHLSMIDWPYADVLDEFGVPPL
jgi:hypothetical protein